MKRKFEEILEECLSAHLEGRRSFEESLSLYPSLAAELEPLLRTAASVSDSFRDHSPSPYRQEVGRQRFLTAASARALTSRINGFDRSRSGWGVRQWGLLGAAAAAAVTVVLLAGLSIGGDGGSSTTVGNVPTPAPSASARPEFVASIKDAQAHLNRLKDKTAQGQRIGAEDIQALAEKTEKLAEQAVNEESKAQLQQVIQQQIVLLHQIAESPPAGQDGPVRNVLSLTEDLAKKWGIPIFTTGATPASGTPTPTPTSPPVGTPIPVPTAEPTATPAPEGTPAPSPVGSPDSSTLPTPAPVRVPLSAP
jgi:hypothetical protein